MKLLIKLSDLRYQQLKDDHETFDLLHVLADAVKRGKQLPEDPTNGDVIEALFPGVEVNYALNSAVTVKFNECQENMFGLDWWNAPYKGVNDETDN